MTFSYSNPEKLLEFYSDQNKKSLELNFIFHSSDHIRYQNGIPISGPHGGASRAIKVETNLNNNEIYTVTIFNTDSNQNIVQMAPKQMKLLSYNSDTIELKGYGRGLMGEPFEDYGLTILQNDGKIEECILHIYSRSIYIQYFTLPNIQDLFGS
mgnify:CR=1 FL=1